MAPKPDDDLFIEPADDEDVVYGDYNNTMDGSSSSGPRPYIRLTSQLRNATKNEGGEVRFRCEAVGTPPLNFSWFKNYAPVEKSRRVKIRTKENSSRLVISELDVLDSGFYQCIASNSAASVNSTSILRVNNVPDAVLKNRKSKTQSIEEYEDYELMDRGRLPDEEDADLYRVPDNAGGVGYMPDRGGENERWLDGMKYRVGDCVQYRGAACRNYLAGRHVMLTSENREEMYDIDRNIRAAKLFINSAPTVSDQCRDVSHSVACFHMYKVCDPTAPVSPTGNRQPLTICKSDCDRIAKDVCPSEIALAAQHELVGDGPKALFPSCPALPHSSNCIPVLQTQLPTSSETPKPHWCYTNIGTTYEGAISTTITGKTCMMWEDSTSRDFNVRRYPELLRAKNHCRNPGGKKTRPWCFSHPLGQEEYCDVQPCPKDMYPHLKETPRDGNGMISATDSVTHWWESLPSQWQYGLLIGGVSFFILLIFLICCLCCCRAKKKKGKSRGPTNHMSAPPSIVNSGVNSAYYRKMNGTSTPIVGRGAGPMEMAHLLPHQMGIPPPYPEFRQQEIIEEPYTVRSIAPNQLHREQLIGEGQFGMIHQGRWAIMNGEPLQVAIKSVRIDPSNADRANLEEEVRIVAPFDHPHVTKLLGVVYWNPNQMSAVFEFMVHGDLYEFLRLRDPGSHSDGALADTEEFMRIATQIAYGMEYLASMNYVHRDLATRNCLVWDNHMIKISDFPLMKECHHADYYKMPHRTWVPVRWMSKESLEQGRFSEASDIWAFGVTLWEIWSYGRQPYEGHTNQQVIEFVANRNLLECPFNCPAKIYSLMVECWTENPDRRPNFTELHSRLQTWSVASPAHSILNPARNSNSSQSGSSMSGRGPQKPIGVSQTRQPYNPRGGRRLEDASPLMRREGNYTYSEDDVESD